MNKLSKKILVVAEKTPQYEGGSGGQKILYSSYYKIPDIHFCIINDKPNKKQYLDNPHEYVSSHQDKITPKQGWRYGNFIKSFTLKQDRFVISENWISQIRAKIEEIIVRNKIDILVFEQTGLLMWSWYKYFSGETKCILRVHDSHHHNLQLDIKTRINVMSKLSLYGSFISQKRYEHKHLNKWDQVQFLSHKEYHYYKEKFPEINQKISYTPPSIFTQNNEYLANPVKKIDVLFVGTMSWKPNSDAVLWFLEDVLPIIKKEINDVKVSIIGKNASQKIKCDENSVEVVGFVESLEEIYKSTKLAINPSISGGGIKVKLMEYAAYGIPIITTSQGISGFKENIRKCLIVDDTAEDFANSVIKFLKGHVLREELSQKVFKYAQEEFNYKENQEKWLNEVRKLL